jgi:hypothetical protein
MTLSKVETNLLHLKLNEHFRYNNQNSLQINKTECIFWMNIREINFINTFKQLKNFKCDLRIALSKHNSFIFHWITTIFLKPPKVVSSKLSIMMKKRDKSFENKILFYSRKQQFIKTTINKSKRSWSKNFLKLFPLSKG